MSHLKPVLEWLLHHLPPKVAKKLEHAINHHLNELEIENVEREGGRLIVHYRDELGPGTAVYTEEWADSEPGTITALTVAIKAEEEGHLHPREAKTIAKTLQRQLAPLIDPTELTRE